MKGLSSMPEEAHIDLSEIVELIASVLIEPYEQFLSKLHADGRISEAELANLRHEVESRGPRLGKLLQEQLRQNDASR
jgi:hypothetical protein